MFSRLSRWNISARSAFWDFGFFGSVPFIGGVFRVFLGVFRVFLGMFRVFWGSSGFFGWSEMFRDVPGCTGVPVFLEVLHAKRFSHTGAEKKSISSNQKSAVKLLLARLQSSFIVCRVFTRSLQFSRKSRNSRTKRLEQIICKFNWAFSEIVRV